MPGSTRSTSAHAGAFARIGLAPSPSNRFASALELRDAFVQALRGGLTSPLRNRGRALLTSHP